MRTTTSDYPTIEASSLADAIDLDETEDERANVEAPANHDAAVNEAELLAKEASAEPTAGTRGLETSEVEARSVEKKRPLADETPQPSDSDLPDFRPRRRGRVVFAAIVASAAAIVVAGVAWSRFARHDEQPVARLPPRVAERAAEHAPVPPSPPPAPSPVAPATAIAPSTPAPAPEATVAAEKTPGSVTVKVTVVPEGAVVFRAGKRLGSGVVEVSVEPKEKLRLTALHDGYLPSNFVLDGSRDSLTIRLKRIPKPRSEPASQVDSPDGVAPAADAPATSAPATTDAPAATTAPAATAAPVATAAFPAGTTAPPATAPTAPSTESPAK